MQYYFVGLAPACSFPTQFGSASSSASLLEDIFIYTHTEEFRLSSQVRFHVCRDCGQQFVFTPRRGKSSVGRGFSRPTRCPDCLARHRDGQAMPDAAVSPFGDFHLDSRLDHAVSEAGFDTPTAVQSAAIPLALSGRDLIGTAQTGTGKTAAFVLPILHRLLNTQGGASGTRALVVTPTRELAEQITAAVKSLSRYTKIRVASVYGGVNMKPQERALRDGVEIIVACPGRLLDHIERKNTNLGALDTLVLDEADRMLDMGFLPQIRRILRFLPSERQTMLFSATFAPELEKLASGALRDPVRVEADVCAPPRTIAHALCPCPQKLKTPVLLELLKRSDAGGVLVFTRTRHRAERLAKHVADAGFATASLHSDKSQGQRQRALEDFRSGRCRVMVATDIAARGLDINTISHVINYDMPDGPDSYIHRIGRTGRAQREGDALTLVTPEDHATVWAIERALGERIETRKLDGFSTGASGAASQQEKPLAPIRRWGPGIPRSSAGSAAPFSG